MLIFIPIIMLLFFAGGINLLAGRYRLSLGTAWLFTAAAVLIVWISMITFRITLPDGVSISNWSPQGIGEDRLVFSLSERTWIFAFLLVSLLVGVVFTDTVRFGQSNNMLTWTGSMILTAVGLLSIFSHSFLAVIITFTIIDIVEFGILIKVTDHSKVHSALMIEFITRVIGTVLVLAALIFSKFHSAFTDNTHYTLGVYLLILMGATLRLGIFPLHVPLTGGLPIRRSLGTILRFVSPLSVVAFLSQIQHQQQQQFTIFTEYLFAMILLVCLYAAIKWIIASNELSGRPYWMLSLSGLIIIQFLHGQVEGAIALSIIMMCSGSFIFLYSYSSKVNISLAFLLGLSLIGLPFSPSAPFWSNLAKSQGRLSQLIIMISISLLFLGFFLHIFRQRDQTTPKEGWMRLFYSTGLLFLVIVPWITIIWRFKIIIAEINWILPIICMSLIAIISTLMRRKIWRKINQNYLLNRFRILFEVIGKMLNAVFQLDWFYILLRKLFDLIARPLKFFVNLLEGDGGLLWAFVFLSLIFSVLIGEFLI